MPWATALKNAALQGTDVDTLSLHSGTIQITTGDVAANAAGQYQVTTATKLTLT